jgi:hypothetical protein
MVQFMRHGVVRRAQKGRAGMLRPDGKMARPKRSELLSARVKEEEGVRIGLQYSAAKTGT